MGKGILSPSEMFKQHSTVAAVADDGHHIPPIYIEAPLIYVLSHDSQKNIVPLIDDIAKDRAKGAPQGIHMPESDAHETFSQFKGRCEKAISRARQECVGADLPVGETEPGLVMLLGQMSLQELQMIRNFAILGRDDKLFLLEHPEVIEMLASGQIALDAEGIREEIHNLREHEEEQEMLHGSDRKMQRYLIKVHDVFHHYHVTQGNCTEEEAIGGNTHPAETPVNAFVVAHTQSYDPDRDGEYSNN